VSIESLILRAANNERTRYNQMKFSRFNFRTHYLHLINRKIRPLNSWILFHS